MEVGERDRHDNQLRYEDVQVVVDAYADLTDEQRNQIDVAKIIEHRTSIIPTTTNTSNR